jgi:hypothetical protein
MRGGFIAFLVLVRYTLVLFWSKGKGEREKMLYLMTLRIAIY